MLLEPVSHEVLSVTKRTEVLLRRRRNQLSDREYTDLDHRLKHLKYELQEAYSQGDIYQASTVRRDLRELKRHLEQA